MYFYFEGSSIGLAINSWIGVLFLFYFIIEIVSLITTKMLIVHKLILLPFIVFQIRKILPRHWQIKKNFLYFLLMKGNSFNRFELYVEFITNLKLDNVKNIYLTNPSVTNDFITVNFFGKIISKKFDQNIYNKDLEFSNEIKQFNRNERLKDLGL